MKRACQGARAIGAAALLVAMLGAYAQVGNTDYGDQDGAYGGVRKTAEECAAITGHGDNSVPPGCECHSLEMFNETGVYNPCQIPIVKGLEGLNGEARELLLGILWLMGHAQLLTVLIAGLAIMALAANAYFGTFNTQWLASIAAMTLVAAGTSQVASYLGSELGSTAQYASIEQGIEATRNFEFYEGGVVFEEVGIPEPLVEIRGPVETGNRNQQ